MGFHALREAPTDLRKSEEGAGEDRGSRAGSSDDLIQSLWYKVSALAAACSRHVLKPFNVLSPRARHNSHGVSSASAEIPSVLGWLWPASGLDGLVCRNTIMWRNDV